jgi:4'-phosphopantetheinyl transferase
MPVIFEKQIDAAKKLAVWHITESGDALFSLNSYSPRPDHSKKRNLEQAVSRILLNYLLGYDAHINLSKDIFGKPFLNNSDISLSFSHSKQMVACMVAMDERPVGIDIEIIRQSIAGIAHKFHTSRDQSPLQGIMANHLIWGGKEVLYKIYAKKELDFIENLNVKFNGTAQITSVLSGEGLGWVHKGEYLTEHQLGFEILGDFMLVWGS